MIKILKYLKRLSAISCKNLRSVKGEMLSLSLHDKNSSTYFPMSMLP